MPEVKCLGQDPDMKQQTDVGEDGGDDKLAAACDAGGEVFAA